MVIRDLNLESVAVDETKADAPLIVNADRMLSFPLPLKPMKLIPGRALEVLQP